MSHPSTDEMTLRARMRVIGKLEAAHEILRDTFTFLSDDALKPHIDRAIMHTNKAILAVWEQVDEDR